MNGKEIFKNMTERPGDFRRRSDIERTNTEILPGDTELRLAIEATGLGIFDYYPLTGDLHWSTAAKEHFGLSPDAHVNYNVFLVGLHPRDRGRVDQQVRRALQRENDGKYSTEYRTIGIEDEKERWVAARGRAFFNQHGEAVRFIGTTEDVTERKRAEEELKRLVSDLERSNKDLQQSASGASHNLQGPLRTLAKQVELLALKYKETLDP